MWYVTVAAIFFLVGACLMFFVMRNNPKYFNIDKMAKDQLEALIKKAKEKLGV